MGLNGFSGLGNTVAESWNILENHTETQYAEVEGIHKDYQSPDPGPVQDTPGVTPCP